MLKLHTKETLPEQLPELGVLVPPEHSAREVCLLQYITIPGAGHFTRKEKTGLLDDRGLERFLQRDAETEAEEAPQENHCAGVVLPQRQPDPVGQVRLQSGCYTYCMPVYAPSAVSDSWAVRGYLPMQDGSYVTVAHKRRLALKVFLALLAVLAVGAGYAIYAYGWQAVYQTVTAWLSSLT